MDNQHQITKEEFQAMLEQFKELPPVRQYIVRQVYDAANPKLTLESYLTLMNIKDDDTLQLTRKQYWMAVMELASIDELRQDHHVGDSMLPLTNIDSSYAFPMPSVDNLSTLTDSATLQEIDEFWKKQASESEGKPLRRTGLIPLCIGAGASYGKTQLLTPFSSQIFDSPTFIAEIGEEAIKEKINNMLKAERIALVMSSSELEQKIMEALPDSMKDRVDIILLKGETDITAEIVKLEELYKEVKIVLDVNNIKSYDEIGRLARARLLIEPPRVAELASASIVTDMAYREHRERTDPSPIYNPKQRGQKKGGYKNGFNPGFRRR